MKEIAKHKQSNYHLWTFMTSKLIAGFGAQVYAFAVSFYILQLTGSATNFALNLICNILPRTLTAPFAGYLADKYSKKTIVILSQLGTVIAIGGLLVISLTAGLSLIAIYTTTVILSICSTFTSVTFTASITGLIHEQKIQQAMSLNQVSISLAAIVSPAVGGIMYGFVHFEIFLIVYMIASIIAVVLESTMNFKLFAPLAEEQTHVVKEEKLVASLQAGMHYIKQRPIIARIILVSVFVNFLMAAYQVGHSYILIDQLKMISAHVGLTEGAFAIGMLILSIYLSMRKELKYPLLVTKWAIVGIGLILVILPLPLIVSMPYRILFGFYLLIAFLFGAVVIVTNTPIQVMLQKSIDNEFKGRVFAILETLAMVLMPLGIVIYGFLYDWFSPQWILMISGCVISVIVLFMLRPSILKLFYMNVQENKHQTPQPSSIE